MSQYAVPFSAGPSIHQPAFEDEAVRPMGVQGAEPPGWVGGAEPLGVGTGKGGGAANLL